MKKLLIGLFLTISFSGYAQKANSLNDFKAFRKQMKNDFQQFEDNVHQEYENLKKAIWKEFEGYIQKPFQKPKPKVLPIYIKDTPITKPIPIVIKDDKPIIVIPKIKLPKNDFINKSNENFKEKLKEIIKSSNTEIKVDFYGAIFTVFTRDISLDFNGDSKENILEGTRQLASVKENIEMIVFQLANYAQIMKLNDYTFLQLVRKTADKIFNNDRNKATLFTWFVANLKGYDVRIAYTSTNRELYFLVKSEESIYNTLCYYVSGKRYYILSFNSIDKKSAETLKGKIYSYVDNPLKSKFLKVDFLFEQAPEINEKVANSYKKIESYKIANIDDVNLQYNISYVELFKEMPRLEHSFYYQMPMSKKSLENLANQLKPLLEGKTEPEKVYILMRFLHNFPYKLDIENFAERDKPLTAEEMMYYKFSDCEDHAALFSRLVTHFTNCEVLGVLLFTKTAGHATTAVKFPKGIKPEGYYLPAPYDDYLMCDPTYFGAPIGMCMNDFINVRPHKVFKVKK